MIDISIIITNYNYSLYLNRSIRSAFVQHYPEEKFEIIVVDDSSTDWSKEIIDSYGKLIRKIYLENNMGLAAARNHGIKLAEGKYILFLDADDYLSRDILLIESKFLELNPDWGAAACDYYLIDLNEEIIGRNSCIDNPIACGIMFRKRNLLDIGMYDESFRMHEERDLQIRFSKKFKIGNLSIPLYRYRRHNDNLTNNRTLSSEQMDKLKNKYI